ncbi:MAG: hypothetical protein AAF202_04120 [Pseudomonadota bacterium]
MSSVIVSLLILAPISLMGAEESSLIDWLASNTSISSGNYELVSETSDESCLQAGEISVAEKDGFLTVFFANGLLAQGVGKKVYSGTGKMGPSCKMTVATSEIPKGLSLLITRSCGESSSSVEKRGLLKVEQGFRIVNETKVSDGDWKLGTTCSYRPQNSESRQ